MFNIIGKRFWYFLVSGIVILAGIIALVVFGLQPGVEFSSGFELNLTFNENVTVTKSQVVQALADIGYGGKNSSVRQIIGAQEEFIIDLAVLDDTVDNDTVKNTLQAGLQERLGEFEISSFESVPRETARQMTRNAIIAVVIAAIGMLLYISWAFHRMPNPIRWGTCAIIALVHDLLIVVGVFALLGGIFGWQIDLMFVAGMLTVIGYSINDSIVIFDRIRENIKRNPGADFELLVNHSLVETISRTLITGVGTIFVLVALSILVGDPIQNLVAVLLVGVITGTYSGMCTAAPLLVVWNKGEWGRFIGRKST
jgi:preprotein translocase subunit SecF